MRLRPWLAALLVCFALPVVLAGTRVTALPAEWISPASSPSQGVMQLPSKPDRAIPLEKLPPTQQLQITFSLPLRHQEELLLLLQQLYTPGSTHYHHYLTPGEFASRFAPSPEDYQAVTDFARAHGFSLKTPPASRMLVETECSVATAEKTFAVRLRNYQHPAEVRTFFAPESEPRLPVDLPILELHGLTDFFRVHPPGRLLDPVPALGSAPGGNYMGRDFRKAYAPGVPQDGTGQLIGMVEFDGYLASDIAAYEKLAGLPPIPLINVLVGGFDGVGSSLEVSLDIEAAISMAPGIAAVVVFEAPDNGAYVPLLFDRLSSSNQIKQFSCSWGFGSSGTIDSYLLKLAVQGQSMLICSGDSDAFVTPQNLWTESPYATSVGGTVLTMIGNGDAYSAETVWNPGPSGSSGGVSSRYGIPIWQQGLDMWLSQGSTTMRNLPDVALTAAGVWAVYGDGRSGSFQGTSCATPLWAGFLALVNQEASRQGSPSVGFVNPALYALAQTPDYSLCFHDIIDGNNTSFVSPSAYYAVPGYDLCTGLGSPTGSNLISALAWPPVVVVAPQSLSIYPGSNVLFEAQIGGVAPLYLQWQLNQVDLPGATNTSLLVTQAQEADFGDYTLIVSNAFGVATSAVATLSSLLPTIVTPLSSSTNYPGEFVTLSVSVSGFGPFRYRWQHDGFEVPDYNVISTVAGNGSAGSGGDRGPAIYAGLNSPGGVAVDPAGTLFIADTLNGCVRAVYTNGSIGTAFAGLSNPLGLATDKLGNLYVSDTTNNRVYKRDPNGFTRAVAGGGTADDGVPATAARLHNPSGVLADSKGNLFIADTLNNRVRKVDTNGIISTVAGNRGIGNSGDGGFATNAPLYHPIGLALDSAGNLYISDSNNSLIRRVDTNGIITTIAGGGFGADGGAATNAQLYHPRGVACDGFGNVLFADYGLARIRRVDPAGLLTTFAGTGVRGNSGDGGLATLAKVSPTALTFGPQGNLYFADPDYNVVRSVGSVNLNFRILDNLSALDAGTYSVIISNPHGSITNSAVLTVAAPPLITGQPASQTAGLGGDATFSVTAAGSGPMEYSWYFSNPLPLPGATKSVLALSGLEAGAAGNYHVVIGNAFGSVTSSIASLTLLVSKAAPRLALVGGNADHQNHPFAFQVFGQPGQNIVIESSMNLHLWVPLATNQFTGQMLLYTAPATSGESPQFYRARLK